MVNRWPDDIHGWRGQHHLRTGQRNLGMVTVLVDTRDGDHTRVCGRIVDALAGQVSSASDHDDVTCDRLLDGSPFTRVVVGRSLGNGDHLCAVIGGPGDPVGDRSAGAGSVLYRKNLRLWCDPHDAE